MAISTLSPTAYFSSFSPSNDSLISSSPFKPFKLPTLWPWQKESMDSDLQRTFNLAVENGINLFDTADSYGTGRLNGQSEKLLGKFIREFQGQKQIQDNIVIATKFAAYPWRLTPGQFVNACKSSLDRMQLEQIGIGQLHWSTANYAPLQELALWDGLVAMYEKGLVRAVGVSNYGPKQLVKIHDYLKARGVPLCSAQVQFSLLSMGEDQIEIKNICGSLGIRLISYSPLGLGMLTGKYTPSKLPRGPRALLFRQILPGLEPLLNSLREIAQKRRKTIPQVSFFNLLCRLIHFNSHMLHVPRPHVIVGKVEHRCLLVHSFHEFLSRKVAINWCICQGTIPIPGVKTVKQVEENLGALGWRLSSDELLQLGDAARESPGKMIQNIFQTSVWYHGRGRPILKQSNPPPVSTILLCELKKRMQQPNVKNKRLGASLGLNSRHS
ncbi:Pyridoxal reductase, chloroplastic [Vitis vinifera]|uniref:Pyridoxal reductase, chloroplastic n=1 Tax=Vitis vinifera TaxID=29760 RepID=A0A438HX20_VITVI|nr:Pyridoxal reductase, chloroplastic [Vitis vinifera]